MTRSRRLRRLVGAVLVVTACTRSPYTGRIQSMGLDEDEALALADRAGEQYRRRIRVLSDPATVERVDRVATRVIAAAKTGPAADRAAKLHWEIVVADDAATHVAVLENGQIFLGSALVRLAASDAELAGPIGHAVAQVILRHPSERARPRFIPQAITEMGVTPVARSETLTPLEAAQQDEADFVGLLLAAQAGYDPEMVLPILARLGQPEREARLRERLPEIRDALGAQATGDATPR